MSIKQLPAGTAQGKIVADIFGAAFAVLGVADNFQVVKHLLSEAGMSGTPWWLLLAIGLLLLFWGIFAPTNDSPQNGRRASAKATGKMAQAASTTGDYSPISLTMGPEEVPQRSLKQNQIRAIEKAIATAPPATVLAVRLRSRESQTYLLEFLKILKKQGWKVLDFMATRSDASDIVTIAWIGEKTRSYEALIEGIKAAKIPFEASEATCDDERFKIIFDVGKADMDAFQAAADRIE